MDISVNMRVLILISGGSRISPGGGANSPGGATTYDFAKFSQKLHEIERIWTRGAPPLGPPLLIVMCMTGLRMQYQYWSA